MHTLQIIDESHKHANHKKDTQGGHFKLLIISEDFENVSLIKRHQLIYDALSDMIKIDIHAISIKAKTIKRKSFTINENIKNCSALCL